MYAIYAYIDPPNHPNLGIYAIHGVSGIGLGLPTCQRHPLSELSVRAASAAEPAPGDDPRGRPLQEPGFVPLAGGGVAVTSEKGEGMTGPDWTVLAAPVVRTEPKRRYDSRSAEWEDLSDGGARVCWRVGVDTILSPVSSHFVE